MFMLAAPGLAITLGLNAQTFTVLHTFDSSDGANPQDGVILSSNRFYGITIYGGSNGVGTVFALNTDGTGFTNLYNFTGGIDGYEPCRSLLLSGNTLYGTALSGGSNGDGTIFALNTDGTGFTNLYAFTGGSNGETPLGGLILSSNTLYGTTRSGGIFGAGTIFAMNTDGTGFTNLHSFNSFNVNDGAGPNGGLILLGNTLYGTTFQGGSNNDGTVFASILTARILRTCIVSPCSALQMVPIVMELIRDPALFYRATHYMG